MIMNSEDLSFEDNSFDLVYCFTVLEHVSNVKESIREAIRVTKQGGFTFIFTPDYRQIFEGHYKLFLPLVLPRIIIKAFLILKRRPLKFIDSLQFVNSKMLRMEFEKYQVASMFIYWPLANSPRKAMYKLQGMIRNLFGIEPNQFWLLKKIDDRK
jgi:2-polyprenyl-3-methyl-5-hydroxy-6-metoxy-1,4-benzoquinol methylase